MKIKIIKCQDCGTIGSERRGDFKAESIDRVVALKCVKCGSFNLKLATEVAK